MEIFSNFGLNNGTCNAYSSDSFNKTFNHHNKLFVLNFNIRSFNSNFDDFSAFLCELSFLPDIVILTETWFSDTNCGNIPGFEGVHCVRDENRRGGGVSIFFKSAIQAKISIVCNVSRPEIEYLHIKLCFSYNAIDLLAVYRPPNPQMLDAFFSNIDEILESISVGQNLILAGDFNICMLSQSQITQNFLDIARSYSLIPHISIPTRPNTNGNDTLIDHIWSNFGVNFKAGVFQNLGITDHQINFVLFPTSIERTKIKISFRDHSDQSIQSMIDRLVNFKLFFPLLTANSDFNSKFDMFCTEIDRIYKTSCPLKIKEISEKNVKKPWINRKLVVKIKRKHYLFKRYKDGGIPYSEYKTYESRLSKEIKKSKKIYYQNKFRSCAGDSKETWKVTNTILGNCKLKKSSAISIELEGVLKTDEKEICNIFNDYFINIGRNLAENLEDNASDPLDFMGDRVPNSFFFSKTDPAEIRRIVSKFKNKKTTVNNIPTFVFKKISDVISPILAELFNDSIRLGIFPDKLKFGRVIPLHKSGPQTSVSNFRPITTLSIYSKVFEKLVHIRMTKFIDKFNLVNQNQFGFRKNKNTSDAILEFLDNVYDSFNNSEQLLAIYLDFSKAFDTISFDILLKKMEYMGFRGPIYSWLKSFLQNRKQCVNIGSSSSDILTTGMGVPQGSTLGPLFFLLYINDMVNCLSSLNVIHFADDSTLYGKYSSAEVSNDANLDLASLNSWLSANKLYLNVNKTKYMILSNRKQPTNLVLKIGSSAIERTNVHKFLGVHIDEQLRFSVHTDKSASKIASGVGVIRRMEQHVPKSVLLQLHYALVHSKFTYAITTYGSAGQNSIRRISNLINRSLKIVTNKNRITLDICKHEKLFDFHLSYKYFTCIKMFQIVKLNMHSYFTRKFQSFQIQHSHDTRGSASEHLTIPRMRLVRCQRSFLFTGTKNWNQLPVTVRNSENLKEFKKLLRIYIFS